MTTNTHIAAQRAAFESAEPGRNHDRKDNGEYADCWTEGEWKEFRDGWQAALQWSAQALEAAELGEGEAPVRGRSAIVSAWNNLPDDIRQSPEMRDLHAAIQDCDDAPPAPALDVQGGIVAWQYRYLTARHGSPDSWSEWGPEQPGRTGGFEHRALVVAAAPPPLALVEPLSEEAMQKLWNFAHGEVFTLQSRAMAFGRGIERAHGIVTKESAHGV